MRSVNLNAVLVNRILAFVRHVGCHSRWSTFILILVRLGHELLEPSDGICRRSNFGFPDLVGNFNGVLLISNGSSLLYDLLTLRLFEALLFVHQQWEVRNDWRSILVSIVHLADISTLMSSHRFLRLGSRITSDLFFVFNDFGFLYWEHDEKKQ